MTSGRPGSSNARTARGLALGDIDRDGDPDVVIGGIWFENPGSILDGAWQPHKFGDWHPSASVEVADINGDGRPDIVLAPSELAGNWYRLSWFEAPADPRQAGWTEHVIVDRIECVVHGLATADFNGDGAVDIAASEMHQGQDPDEVIVFANRKHGSAWDKQVLSTKGSHCIQAGDIGADGDIDLVGANWSGPYQPVELWENQSGGVRGRRWLWDYRFRCAWSPPVSSVKPRPVEVPLDFTQLLKTVGPDGSRQRSCDSGSSKSMPAGRVMHEMIPVQFDKDPDDDPKTALRGTLTFMLGGQTAAHAERFFHVYFDFKPHVTLTDIAVSQVVVRTNGGARRPGELQDRQRRRRPITTTSRAPVLRASRTGTAAIGSPTIPVTGR